MSSKLTVPLHLKKGEKVEWDWKLESGTIDITMGFKGTEGVKPVYKGDRVSSHKDAFQAEEDSLAGLKQSVVQSAVDGLAEALKTGVVEEVLLTEYYTCSDYTTSLADHAVRAIERAQERLGQEGTLMRNSIPEERIQRGIVFRCLRLLDKEVKERTLFIHYNRVIFLCVRLMCREDRKR